MSRRLRIVPAIVLLAANAYAAETAPQHVPMEIGPQWGRRCAERVNRAWCEAEAQSGANSCAADAVEDARASEEVRPPRQHWTRTHGWTLPPPSSRPAAEVLTKDPRQRFGDFVSGGYVDDVGEYTIAVRPTPASGNVPWMSAPASILDASWPGGRRKRKRGVECAYHRVAGFEMVECVGDPEHPQSIESFRKQIRPALEACATEDSR